MKRYQIISLVDITRTDPDKAERDIKTLGQQSNFNTLLQVINLRANISEASGPKVENGRLPDPLRGKGRVWIYEFETEREDCFLMDSDPVGHLIEDLDKVPVISTLTETIDLDPAIFQTRGPYQNVWITII